MHIKLIKHTASYDDATLNEKGMIPKGKEGGLLNLDPIGGWPCVTTMLFCC